ncbi:multiple epidermal growth factor-like domains protein 6 [Bombyx mandarina]|uniref:Multiple epidermal growth factor-like domains protein 6 n=1 Tax=Bombyx mandarina TaxID=7092 RepID=A0A6J2JXJ6_BOMMA|nr:multiple epidermal growth factor-like domains protein 6 [Bombyx mandarina]
MSARAPAYRPALGVLVALAFATRLVGSDDINCTRDGLYADYDKECKEYVRCSGGTITGRYTCRSERSFSEVAGACVPQQRRPCVRRVCTPGDTLAYAMPGTACKHYYRCENGTAVDRACPSSTWFDLDRQACARGAGTCYEPVCAGLPDGEYPDSSHECRRLLRCVGGELRAVVSCTKDTCATACPSPRSAAVPIPAGDADFCSDEACSSLCQNQPNGAYADRTAGCREYFVCETHRVIRRGVCEPGMLFSKAGCEPATRAICPPPALSPCFNRPDGMHRDWRSCSSWFDCRRERVISRGTCATGLVFDGTGCVPATQFPCDGPERSQECEGLPSGTYQDLDSNCTKYFHCEGASRTVLSCGVGLVFDGARCSPAEQYLCPSLERDSCYGKADGRYRAADTGCRGYYSCVAGEKSVYACPSGSVFDGEACVPAQPGICPREDYSCDGLSDGYHPEIESGCHRYFYCEGGDRLATLSCLGGKIFDGHACVETPHHECGALPSNSIERGGPECERDGFFVQEGTGCKRYYFCVSGNRTYLTCPEHKVFNGQVCVPSSQYSCPG